MIGFFRLSWQLCVCAEFPLRAGLLYLRPLPFPFSKELCSNEHVDPFEQEPFDVHDLQSLLFPSPSLEEDASAAQSRAFLLRDQMILSLFLEDVIHLGSQSSVALRFFLQKNVWVMHR